MPLTQNNTLWQSILGFNFDDAEGDYCFSVRLAQEQGWTEHFTQQAILEYRRFMYLAATENVMVSPSPIVDEVWHLHLLFTESYRRFCRLLGKEIAHIPSTHSQKEASKFKEATEQTARAYEQAFGALPAAIWEHSTMAAGLGLNAKRGLLKRVILLGLLMLALLFPLFVLVLRPLYLKLNNPYFLLGYGGLVVLTFYGLHRANRSLFRQLADRFPKDSFPFHLSPAEGVFLKTGKRTAVVASVVNSLVQKRVVVVNSNKTLQWQPNEEPLTGEESLAAQVLEQSGALDYPTLLRQLLEKPRFQNTGNGGTTLQQTIQESRWFSALFGGNFCVLGFVFLLGLTRLVTGIVREKPVAFLAFFMLVFFCFIVGYLARLLRFANTITLPHFYKSAFHSREVGPEWNYFLLDAAGLHFSFAPLLPSAGKDASGTDGVAVEVMEEAVAAAVVEVAVAVVAAAIKKGNDVGNPVTLLLSVP